MKVQTKITLLLAVVVAVFLAGLASIRYYEKVNFRRIAEARFTERNRSFDDFLESYGAPLRTLAEDSTCFDQLVQAIASEDQAWLAQYFNDAMLAGFRANAIWVYRQNGTLLYQHDNLHAQLPPALPVPGSAFSQLFAHDPLRRFFVKVPLGFMEVRAGTVHPSQDFARQSPAYGYFFVGRLWSKRAPGGPMSDSVIGEMSLFTNNEIHLVSADARVPGEVNDVANGQIVFSRSLSGWDGAPLARLVITNDSPMIRELNRSSERLLLALIIFSLVLLLLLTVSLQRWVRRPLQRIMHSLKSDDPRPIESLLSDGSEYGALARTVHEFFEQRRNLLREMSERRATEAALRKSEEELRHSQKLEAVGQLAGGVAHDFNNLLTAIIGYAELITARADNPTLVRQGAGLIRKAGGQAAGLTRQLLAFSRKQLLQPRVIDLNSLVVDMERLLRRVIGERYELVTMPEAKPGRVRADPTQLEQVIMNLGVNARCDAGRRPDHDSDEQSNPGRGPGARNLRFVRRRRLYSAYLYGHRRGMDAATLSHIFEPFFTTKGPGKGTGLGLATVYGIVRQSGGGIAVESAPGRGTTFTIYLPREDAPLDEIRAAGNAVEPSRDFETILVVEDEEIVRELVREVLDQQGYHVLCASNGREALKMADEYTGKIDLRPLQGGGRPARDGERWCRESEAYGPAVDFRSRRDSYANSLKPVFG